MVCRLAWLPMYGLAKWGSAELHVVNCDFARASAPRRRCPRGVVGGKTGRLGLTKALVEGTGPDLPHSGKNFPELGKNLPELGNNFPELGKNFAELGKCG